jgi:hypothetical protein
LEWLLDEGMDKIYIYKLNKKLEGRGCENWSRICDSPFDNLQGGNGEWLRTRF